MYLALAPLATEGPARGGDEEGLGGLAHLVEADQHRAVAGVGHGERGLAGEEQLSLLDPAGNPTGN